MKNRNSTMKVVILLAVVVLASCEYPEPADTYGPPAESYGPPSDETTAESSTSILKAQFAYPSFYNGGFSTLRNYPLYGGSLYSPYTTYSSRYPYNYRYKPLSLSHSLPSLYNANFGVAPHSLDIIPPIFGGSLIPPLPVNPQVIPPNILPPSTLPPSFLPKPPSIPALPSLPSVPGLSPSSSFLPLSLYKYSYPYGSLYKNYFDKTPFGFPFATFGSFSESGFRKKGSGKGQQPADSYGPPEENPAPTENSVQDDESAGSYPYEAASEASDTPEEAHKPAAEYGPPSKK